MKEEWGLRMINDRREGVWLSWGWEEEEGERIRNCQRDENWMEKQRKKAAHFQGALFSYEICLNI